VVDQTNFAPTLPVILPRPQRPHPRLALAAAVAAEAALGGGEGDAGAEQQVHAVARIDHAPPARGARHLRPLVLGLELPRHPHAMIGHAARCGTANRRNTMGTCAAVRQMRAA
jgi:hypothetical protein